MTEREEHACGELRVGLRHHLVVWYWEPMQSLAGTTEDNENDVVFRSSEQNSSEKGKRRSKCKKSGCFKKHIEETQLKG